MEATTPISRLGVLYLSLGLAQAAHSFEEIVTHLYDFFWILTGVLHRELAWFPPISLACRPFRRGERHIGGSLAGELAIR